LLAATPGPVVELVGKKGGKDQNKEAA
jgi:hypothetical protein